MSEGGMEKRALPKGETNQYGVSREAFMNDLVGLREGLLINALKLTEGNKEHAQDLVQEAMTKAIAGFESYPGEVRATRGSTINPLAAWVYVIMRNHFYEAGRKIQMGKKHAVRVGLHEQVRRAEPNQADALETAQMVDIIKKHMEALSPREREFINLAVNEGLSQEEVAERLKMPLGTVKSGTKRAYDHLRELVKKAVGE